MDTIGAPRSQIVNNRQITVDIRQSPMHDAAQTPFVREFLRDEGLHPSIARAVIVRS
jgi:hypothetical protein